MKPVLIRQHVDSAPAGLLAEWLDARGLAYEIDRTWVEASVPDPEGFAFVASLGHDRMAGDTHDPGVAAERELLALAVARDVPVLGLCYGGQVLAAVLGAEVGAAADGGARVAHDRDRRPGRGARGAVARVALRALLHAARARPSSRGHGRRAAGVPLGPHLGVQFHPEATVEIVEGWARADGVEAELSAPPEQVAAARDAAFRLFDGFLAPGSPLRRPPRLDQLRHHLR